MKPVDLHKLVAEKIAAVGSKGVVDILVDKLSEAEITKRADILSKAVSEAGKIEGDLKKINPVQEKFFGDGKPAGEPTYTKAQIDEMKKLKDRLASIEAAIESATDEEKPDWSKLKNLFGQNNDKKPDPA